MNRRELIRTAPAAKRTNGLPLPTINDAKVITTTRGRNYRRVFLKTITSEPGLYGIGSANNRYSARRRSGTTIPTSSRRWSPWPKMPEYSMLVVAQGNQKEEG